MTGHEADADALLREATAILTRHTTRDMSWQWERAKLLIDVARVHISLAEIESK